MIKENQLLVRDLARTKKKFILYFKMFLEETYKSVTFYNFRKRKLSYPLTLQLPITNKCNLDCAMCNIQSKKNEKEISQQDFENILNNKIFSHIISVGVNGGEPFIIDIVAKVETLVKKLPKLKYIYIITNGTLQKQIEEKLPQIKKICSQSNVILTVSVSVDGVGEMHDKVRCMKGSFERTVKTIRILQANKDKYCDNLNVICTVSKVNVYDLNNIDAFAKAEKWHITYNIATEHERLNNKNKVEGFSLFTDLEAKMVAQEFFYKKFLETKSEQYFSLYSFLLANGKHRPCGCSYLHEGITLTPEGNVCYCATHSKIIGNAINDDIYKVYFNNASYNSELEEKYCHSCSHYMGTDLYKTDRKEYIKAITEPWQSFRL